MPFESKIQQRKCYALRARGENGSWDCDEFSDHTDFKKLPEKKEASVIEAIGRECAELPYVTKLAQVAGISHDAVRHLAASVGMPVIPYVKRAFADPADFAEFLRCSGGA